MTFIGADYSERDICSALVIKKTKTGAFIVVAEAYGDGKKVDGAIKKFRKKYNIEKDRVYGWYNNAFGKGYKDSD